MVFAFFLHSCIVPFTVYTFQFILNYIERCHTCTQTKRRNQLLTNTTRNFNEYWICAISSLQCERMTALELFFLIFGFLFHSFEFDLRWSLRCNFLWQFFAFIRIMWTRVRRKRCLFMQCIAVFCQISTPLDFRLQHSISSSGAYFSYIYLFSKHSYFAQFSFSRMWEYAFD